MTYPTLGAWKENEQWNFRVWAPNADKVSLLLQQNQHWDHKAKSEKVPLLKKGDGYWSTAVDNLNSGLLYRYEIRQNGTTKQALDPAARDVIHSQLVRHDEKSENAAILVDHKAETWPEFHTPAFENFIIYQCHVGSFAGRNDHLGNKPISNFQDVTSKFGYLRELGFNAIQPLPIQEFAQNRSWGYNPGSFFAPESAYGSPDDLREFVKSAHAHGLAVIIDVVYNHAGPGDSVLWDFDGSAPPNDKAGGIYFENGYHTPWGTGPAWWKKEVRDYFLENASMYFEDYKVDGLRFDATRYIEGHHLSLMVGELKQRFPNKFITAEHLPADRWITTYGNFDGTWQARTHHEGQRALNGDNPVARVKSFLGWSGFDHAWNLIKYTMGSHDDCGDGEKGNAEDGLSNWDHRHRYLIDQYGGRSNWHARAKCRLAWALNVFMPGTPLMFMGSECHMGAPNVAWGYWHDGPDENGDHRFDWSIAGDNIAMGMRNLVSAANHLRWSLHSLRSDTLIITHEDYSNNVIAFKRWYGQEVVLAVVNLSDNNFSGYSYGVATNQQFGQWTQVFCSQDASFGGWESAGNAYYEPYTQGDGRLYINLPKWSVLLFKLKN